MKHPIKLLLTLLLLSATSEGFLPCLRKKSAPAQLLPAPGDLLPFKSWREAVINWLGKADWGTLRSLLPVGFCLAGAQQLLIITFPERDITICRLRLSQSNPAVLGLVEAEKPYVVRDDLYQSFHTIVDAFRQSVLVWGEHKSGKTTFVREVLKDATKKGRSVLYVEARSGDTIQMIFTKMFRWNETGPAHFL